MTDRYGWFNGEMVGRLDTSGPLHFIYHDHLGSTRLVVSSTGQVQDDLDYYPFGTAIPKQWTSANMYQFTGYETDTETGTEHAWFRNHSPAMGRYMRPDPYAGSYDVTDPQSLNRYSYVRNRITHYFDPYGLNCVWDDESVDADPSDGGDDQAGCSADGGTWVDGGGGGGWSSGQTSDGNNQQFGPPGTLYTDGNGNYYQVGDDGGLNQVNTGNSAGFSGDGWAAGFMFLSPVDTTGVALATAITKTGAWQIGTVRGVATFYGLSAVGGGTAVTAYSAAPYVVGFGVTNMVELDTLGTSIIDAMSPGIPWYSNPQLGMDIYNFYKNVEF